MILQSYIVFCILYCILYVLAADTKFCNLQVMDITNMKIL